MAQTPFQESAFPPGLFSVFTDVSPQPNRKRKCTFYGSDFFSSSPFPFIQLGRADKNG